MSQHPRGWKVVMRIGVGVDEFPIPFEVVFLGKRG